MSRAKELMPRPPIILDRLSENLRERRVLRQLLRAAEKAAELGNPGGLMPERAAEAEARRAG